MHRYRTHVTINGIPYEAEVDVSMTLLTFLRDVCGLTGTKCGCEDGECGACTIVLDGRPVRSCLVLAAEVDGCHVRTVEGVAKNGQLHPMQQALIDEGAVQCGYCIPGVVMAGIALLERTQTPTKEQVRQALSGHLCRCSDYKAISHAVATTAKLINENG